MGPTPLSLPQFIALMAIETARIENEALRRRAVARYLPPWPVQLIRSDQADHPHYVGWVFAESADQAEGAVYCNRGRADGPARWAIVDLRARTFDTGTLWFEHAADALAAWLGEDT
ncbi:MAG: hypothetical protein AB7Q81_07760 [Gammaproteobacteria bacterium]